MRAANPVMTPLSQSRSNRVYAVARLMPTSSASAGIDWRPSRRRAATIV